jgi:hypothetical protein
VDQVAADGVAPVHRPSDNGIRFVLVE